MESSNMYKRKNTIYLHFFWFVSVLGVIDILFIASGWLYPLKTLWDTDPSGRRGVPINFKSVQEVHICRAGKSNKKFKEGLGRGSSGAVYRGVLGDQQLVQVKKLQDVIQGEEEFWAEVSTIGRINHVNLVRMWEYCSEGTHRLLVSEYVENGSPGKDLFSDGSNRSNTEQFRFLKWKDRFKIAIGTAKGLAYLHHECLEWVVHCDVKPENKWLDSNFEQKIANFGLA